MIGRKLDRTCVTKAHPFEDGLHRLRAHPHLSPGAARLAENDRFLSRPPVPVYDRDVTSRPKPRDHGACKACLVRYAMEGVRHQHEIDWLSHDVRNIVGSRPEKLTVRGTDACHSLSCLLEHPLIDVDRENPPRERRKRRGEPAVAAAKIDGIHPGLDAERKDDTPGIGPERPPPIGVRHRGCGEDSIQWAHKIQFVRLLINPVQIAAKPAMSQA